MRRPAGLKIRRCRRAIDDEQAGGQARDDLAAQPLRGLGARRHRLLLRLSLVDRLLQRRRQQRGLGAASRRCRRASRARRGEPQHRERQHADEHADDRGQAEERVAGSWRHDQ